MLAIGLFSSCTIEKRKYLGGYNIDWKHGGENIRNDHALGMGISTSEMIASRVIEPSMLQPRQLLEGVHTSFPTNTLDRPKSPFNNRNRIRSVIELIPDSCDNIVMQNGSEIRAKVVEITPSEVKYKRCDHLTGPTITVAKSEIFLIQYANGKSEQISTRPQVSTPVKIAESAKEIFAPNIVAMVFGFTAFALAVISMFITPLSVGLTLLYIAMGLGLMALIFGAIGVNRVNRWSDIYKGKHMGVLGIIFGCITLIGGLIVQIIVGKNR